MAAVAFTVFSATYSAPHGLWDEVWHSYVVPQAVMDERPAAFAFAIDAIVLGCGSGCKGVPTDATAFFTEADMEECAATGRLGLAWRNRVLAGLIAELDRLADAGRAEKTSSALYAGLEQRARVTSTYSFRNVAL